MVKMSKTTNMSALCTIFFVVVLSMLATPADSQWDLKVHYYRESCPTLPFIVRQEVEKAIKKEPRMAASLLRVHFHDCFVQGCDGSVLLDGFEKVAPPNLNSLRGFDVIDNIKKAVEKECPKTVSCADISALASYWSVVQSSGIQDPRAFGLIKLGRKDSLTANAAATLEFLPAFTSNVSGLKKAFAKVGLNVQDLVALSGGHTLGLSRCASITSRLYNHNGGKGPDPAIEKSFLANLIKKCPQGGDANVTVPFDGTPDKFDNRYFSDLMAFRGVLFSDEVLFTDTETRGLVQEYAKNEQRFIKDFAGSLIKMGEMQPKAGTPSEVRINCRKPNPRRMDDTVDPLIELYSDA